MRNWVTNVRSAKRCFGVRQKGGLIWLIPMLRQASTWKSVISALTYLPTEMHWGNGNYFTNKLQDLNQGNEIVSDKISYQYKITKGTSLLYGLDRKKLGFNYLSKYYSRRHFHRKHPNDTLVENNEYKCDKCRKIFPRKTLLEAHVNSDQCSKSVTYQCSHCSDQFHTKVCNIYAYFILHSFQYLKL